MIILVIIAFGIMISGITQAFEDDFSMDKGWTSDPTSGSYTIKYNALNQNVDFHTNRYDSVKEKMYYGFDIQDDFVLSVDVNLESTSSGNGFVYIGLTDDTVTQDWYWNGCGINIGRYSNYYFAGVVAKFDDGSMYFGNGNGKETRIETGKWYTYKLYLYNSGKNWKLERYYQNILQDTKEGAFAKSFKVPFKYIIFGNADTGQSGIAKGKIDNLKLSVTPIPGLRVTLSPSTNVAHSGETVPIRVRATRDSLPVDADVEIKINNQVVESFTGSDYTYNFPSLPTQSSVGSYDIEATATYNGLIARDFKKIDVVSKETWRTVILASDLAVDAYAEIFEAEDLVAEKSIESVTEIGTGAIESTIEWLLQGFVKELALECVETAYGSILGSYIDDVAALLGHTINDIISLAEDEYLSNGFEDEVTYAQTMVRQALDTNYDAPYYRSEIEEDFVTFVDYINNNPDKFSKENPSNLARLFSDNSKVITNTVETYQLYQYEMPDLGIAISVPITMKGYSDLYDLIGGLKDVITAVLVVMIAVILIAFIACLFISAGGCAAAAGIVFIKISAYSAIVGKIALSSAFVRLLIVVFLTAGLSTILPAINDNHGDAVLNIISSIESNSPIPLRIEVNDSITGIPTHIKSSGYTLIVSPDGKISGLFNGESDYTVNRAGTYSIATYQHAGRLFSSARLLNFNASNPNITMDLTSDIHGSEANVGLHIVNYEAISLDNLNALVCITNSTGGLVFLKGEMFGLSSSEQKDFSYNLTLDKNDVYTVKAILLINLVGILEEKTLPIKIGVETAEDASIISTTYKDEYSPYENVTLNISIESYAPGLALNISIPAFNYIKPVIVTGTEVLNINLPRLPPDDYVIAIMAERQGKILDSRIISFYVRADGVGTLTFNTSQILYPLGKSSAINLSIKDLNLTNVDALVRVTVFDPSGNKHDYPTIKIADGYQFNFLPASNGTYIFEAHAHKEGWRIDNNTFTAIANQMSPLKINVTMGDYIIVRVTANGLPAACKVTMYTDQGNESFISTNGMAIFDKTYKYYIVADKKSFEPAYFSYDGFSLYYPDFTDTADPNSWRSWLILRNSNNCSAEFRLTIRSRDSSQLYSGILTIPAHGVSTLRPRILVGSDCTGSVAITSNMPLTGTCQITRNSNEMCMGYNAADRAATTLYYPDFTDTANPDSWRSWLVLQNPHPSKANTTLEIRSRAGDVLYTGSQTIPAHGAKAIRPRNLVGSDCAGSVVVTSEQPIVGTCQITRNSNKMCMSYSASDQGATTLYYPDFTDTANPNSWRSWLVLQNPSASPANLSYEIRSRAGDLLFTGSDTIPAHGVNAIRPKNLVGSDCAGSVVVTSDQPIVGTCQITRNSNEMCMSYNALDQASTALSYPDFTDTSNPDSWRSWLVLQNPAATAANITLKIRSRAGDQLYSGSQSIPAHGVAAVRPRSLVGSDCTGSVTVTSDQPIIGTCQITRNNNLMCMSYTATRAASVDWLPTI